MEKINNKDSSNPLEKISLNFALLNDLNISLNDDPHGIEGTLKLEKVLVKTLLFYEEEGFIRPELLRNFRGPTNPGLSRLIQSLSDLKIIELKKMKKDSIKYSIKEKGLKILEGLKIYHSAISNNFMVVDEKVTKKVKGEIGKTGTMLVEDEKISDIKKNKIIGEKL